MARSRTRNLAAILGKTESTNTDGSAIGSGSGVTTYASINNLPLLNTAGDMAFVDSSDRLYISNGEGWYTIGLVNASPRILSVLDSDGGTAPFYLTTDGSATVITVTAADSDGFTPTYSYSVTSGSLTNGGGTTATIVQNNNKFTITPTTTEAYAGTFDLTFTVSDGISLGTNTSQFTLSWGIPYTTVESFSSTWDDGTTVLDTNAQITASYDAQNYKWSLDTSSTLFAGRVINANFLQATVDDGNGVWFKVKFDGMAGSLGDRKGGGFIFGNELVVPTFNSYYSYVGMRGDGNTVNGSMFDENNTQGWSNKYYQSAVGTWWSALYFNASTRYCALYQSLNDSTWTLYADKTFGVGHGITNIHAWIWRRTENQSCNVTLVDVDATVLALI